MQIEGEKYVVTAAEGCQLDKWLKIPESSHASLRFTFPPIPKQAKSMDFIEGDSKDAFKLCDIDLTGRKKEMAKWHPELPQELRKEINDMDIPEPVLTNGRSKVRIHIMGYRDEMSKEITLNAQGFTAFSDNHKVNYDPQKGYAEVELNLYGSTEYFITANRLTSQFGLHLAKILMFMWMHDKRQKYSQDVAKQTTTTSICLHQHTQQAYILIGTTHSPHATVG